MLNINYRKKINLIALLVSCWTGLQTQAKVLIFTFSYNRPDFIAIQHKTFETLLMDDYEFIVFNDARDPSAINNICNTLDIKCIRVPQKIHTNQSAGSRHVDCMQYALKNYGFNYPGIVTFLDSDCFLIKKFSIEQYLSGYDIAGNPQGRGTIQHLSPLLVMMDMRTLPNRETIDFSGATINGHACDNGGKTYYYLQNNPNVAVKYINAIHSSVQRCSDCTKNNITSCQHNTKALQKQGFTPPLIEFLQSSISSTQYLNVELVLDHSFLHYRGGSNWDGKTPGYHATKTTLCNKLIEICLSS